MNSANTSNSNKIVRTKIQREHTNGTNIHNAISEKWRYENFTLGTKNSRGVKKSKNVCEKNTLSTLTKNEKLQIIVKIKLRVIHFEHESVYRTRLTKSQPIRILEFVKKNYEHESKSPKLGENYFT